MRHEHRLYWITGEEELGKKIEKKYKQAGIRPDVIRIALSIAAPQHLDNKELSNAFSKYLKTIRDFGRGDVLSQATVNKLAKSFLEHYSNTGEYLTE